jgi:hypothetical protein
MPAAFTAALVLATSSHDRAVRRRPHDTTVTVESDAVDIRHRQTNNLGGGPLAAENDHLIGGLGSHVGRVAQEYGRHDQYMWFHGAPPRRHLAERQPREQ